MEVKIISTTCIKPSSLLPHLHTYKLSLLDQLSPSHYWTSILFYQKSQGTDERSQLLKQSLSETLSRFYPIAGKVKDNLSIDCTDPEVPYIKAKCNISLSQFLTRPDLEALRKLMPDVTSDELPFGSPVCLIRETTFACGGFSIGAYFSHIVCDGYTGIFFLKEWAASANCKVAVTYPFLGVESIFPQYTAFPRKKTSVDNLATRFTKTSKSIGKRIVFKESAIANLKAKASSNNINNPSRSEVVIAFLANCLMKSFKNNDQALATMIAVNLRRKGKLPLLENSFGNVACAAGTVFTSKMKEFTEIMKQVREALGKVDNEFMEKIQSDGDELFKYYDTVKEILGSHDAPKFAGFSSSCNFGIYDIDFAWGKPIWAANFTSFEHNPDKPNSLFGALLMDTRIGKGVEAWVYLLQEDFDNLEKDSELLQYASIDPSPLCDTFELTSKL